MDYSEKFQDWLQALKLENKSAHTLRAYEKDVKIFMDYFSEKSIDLADIEASDLREFMLHRREIDKLEPSSMDRQLAAIRQFMRFCNSENDGVIGSLEDVKQKKRSKLLPGMVDAETIIKMLDQPAPLDPDQAELWVRDRAILELFYSSGLRLSELRELKMSDLDLNRLQVRVVGKGEKTRIVPITVKVVETVKEWLKIYVKWGGVIDRNSPLFITRRLLQISDRQIASRVKHQAIRAGLSVDMHPHLLRHCFASHMLSASGDIRSIQEMLGHSSLATTQIYTHLDFDHLASIYDKAHPRASKK